MDELIIVGPDGKTQVQSTRYAPCPRCGKGPENRVPSSGFGHAYLVCANCGYEFKELEWQSITR